MVLTFWKKYKFVKNQLNDDFLEGLASELRKAGFSRYNYGNKVKYIRENPFKKGAPPVFHVKLKPTVEISCRPHLGASIPFTLFMLLGFYEVLLRPVFDEGRQFYVAGMVFMVFVLLSMNAVNLALFRSDVEIFEKIIDKLLGKAT